MRFTTTLTFTTALTTTITTTITTTNTTTVTTATDTTDRYETTGEGEGPSSPAPPEVTLTGSIIDFEVPRKVANQYIALSDHLKAELVP